MLKPSVVKTMLATYRDVAEPATRPLSSIAAWSILKLVCILRVACNAIKEVLAVAGNGWFEPAGVAVDATNGNCALISAAAGALTGNLDPGFQHRWADRD